LPSSNSGLLSLASLPTNPSRLKCTEEEKV